MSKVFAPSELILNRDGSVYHLHLQPDDIGNIIFLVGDPERVGVVSSCFDKVELEVCNREFVTHTGYLCGKRISVISTGIGTENIDIVMNELDALVNIDLQKRVAKDKFTSLNIIRLGTAGGLQADIPLNSLVVSDYAIGLEGMVLYYKYQEHAEEAKMRQAFEGLFGKDTLPIKPTVFQSASHLVDALKGEKTIHGITVTCDGFYAAQGRLLRGELAVPDLIDKMAKFTHAGQRVVNFEMETAGIFGLGRVFGHHCCAVSLIVANRINNEFVTQGQKLSMIRMIEHVLAGLVENDV